MIKRFILIFAALTCYFLYGQEWSLKLKSTVQLRTWTLTSRADKDERSCEGANIQLIQNNKVIKELVSDKDGNFVIDIPGNGDYYINVSYPGCNGKKFYVSTKNVSSDVAGNNFKPSVTIGGFMMAKPFTGIDYIGLQEPLLAVEYKNNDFDKDKEISEKGVQIVQNIMDAEVKLIDKFCFQTKLGDEALNKKNYKLAKQYYTKALELIPNEEYPKFKLAKAEEKIKEEEDKKAALAAEAAAQAEAQKLALQKAMEEKKQKENASFNQANNKTTDAQTTTAVKDSIVTAEASDKMKAEIEAKAKAEVEKLAMEKAAKEKAEVEVAKLAAEKAVTEAKLKAEAAAKEKADADAARIAAEKAAKEKVEAEAKAKKEAVDAKLASEKASKEKEATEIAAKKTVEADAKPKKDASSSNSSSATAVAKKEYSSPTAAATTSSNTQFVNSKTNASTINNELPVAENVKGKAKRKIKPQIGSEFNEHLANADSFFQEKKYKEAKQAYNNALKYNPSDHYTINRISQCEQHLKK